MARRVNAAAQYGEGDTAGEPGARRQLRGHRGDGGEDQTRAGQGRPERQRPGGRDVGGQQAGRADHAGGHDAPKANSSAAVRPA